VIFPEFFFSCAATVSPSKVVPMTAYLGGVRVVDKAVHIVGFEEVVDGD
jgi:hypothetical protein